MYQGGLEPCGTWSRHRRMGRGVVGPRIITGGDQGRDEAHPDDIRSGKFCRRVGRREPDRLVRTSEATRKAERSHSIGKSAQLRGMMPFLAGHHYGRGRQQRDRIEEWLRASQRTIRRDPGPRVASPLTLPRDQPCALGHAEPPFGVASRSRSAKHHGTWPAA